MLKVTSLEGNRQKLDGGAMFGNAPRALWSRFVEADDAGRVQLACRAFLVEDGQRRILLEAGVGAFFDEKLRSRYGVSERQHVLLESLAARGLEPADIDAVVLSHLHFDHVGGLVSAYVEGEAPHLVFPQAKLVVSRRAWERARHPHPRDRVSFVSEVLDPVFGSEHLVLVEDGQERVEALGERLRFVVSDGHTPGQLLTVLEGNSQTAVFTGDLIAGAPWVHLPLTTGYDRFAELVIDEKRALYEDVGEGALLLFTHDPRVVAGSLGRDEKGRFAALSPAEVLSSLELD